jgi:four helix bundle protein
LPNAAVFAPFERRSLILAPEIAALPSGMRNAPCCGMLKNDGGIDERAFRFFAKSCGTRGTIKWDPGVNQIIDQLVDAAGSVASNRPDSTSASSPKEFIRFNAIALREAKESFVWLRACHVATLGDQTLCTGLLNEAPQIARILGSIVVTSKANEAERQRQTDQEKQRRRKNQRGRENQ